MDSLADSYTGLALSAIDVEELTGWPQPMVDDYVSILTSLATIANSIDYMAVDAGAPEGVVAANKTRQYYDTAGMLLYVNPVVGATTGWIAV